MNDREALARFNSLLRAGLSMQAAERASGLEELGVESARAFAFIKDLCLVAGGSPFEAMKRLQFTLVAQSRAEAKIRLALATPHATTRLVLWLPLAALFLGQVSGIGSIEVFFKNSISVFSVVIGVILLLAANLWSNRLLRKVQPKPDDLIVLDAMALCLQAGLPLADSRTAACAKFKDHYSRAVSNCTLEAIDQLVGLGETTGTPIARLLIERADEVRANANYLQLEAIEKLQIKMLLPLGVLVLPAFVFVAVIPMAISLLTKG